MTLQKMVKAQNQASNEIINHLGSMEDRRRNNRGATQAAPNFHAGAMSFLTDGAEEPAPELRRARELLSVVGPDLQANRELERLYMTYNQNGAPAEPAATNSSAVMFTQAAAPGTQATAPGMPLVHNPLNDPQNMMYPVAQTPSIDPSFHTDQMHNMPYSRPLSNPAVVAETSSSQITPSQITPPPKDQMSSMWRDKKPRVLLVEDDKTCARIGAKFLSTLDCGVDTAVSISFERARGKL